MRFPVDMTVRYARVWLVALLACAATAVIVPAAQAVPEALGVKSFFAGNCKTGKACTPAPENATPAEEKAKAEAEGYTQASGHPALGVTEFVVTTHVIQTEPFVAVAPNALVTHVRTDVAPGVSTNPQAMLKCSSEEFGEEVAPGTGVFLEPECPAGSIIGVNKVVVLGEAGGIFADTTIEGTAYNLEQPEGLASDFGVALPLPEAATEPIFGPGQFYAHTQIEGHVEWGAEAEGTGKADYHDFYEIKVNPELPLISSRLTLDGDKGTTNQGGFITNPSNCAGPGAATTNTVTLTSKEGQKASQTYTTPIGTEGCNGLSPFLPVPFEPAFALSTETTQSDQPTGVTTELTLPHNPGHSETDIDSSQLRNAIVTLPEGMTLNPSAAYGLEACKPSQIHIGERKSAECPYGSKIGTATINTPDLPPESLKGSIYLGGTESGVITGQPYTVYLNTESKRYGVTVRLKGVVETNATTGRVTAKFLENPEQPFSEVILHFKDGPLAPIANPLACGTATTETTLVPYIESKGGPSFTKTPSSAFTVDSNGSGGACSSPLPFTLTQSSTSEPATAGASTNFMFNVTRPSGQQYLSQIKTVLPAGLVGRIPAVALCTEAQVAEAQANTGGCPASSRIGSVTVLAGAGSIEHAYRFTGSAYLTGPYAGAPYGLAIVVPAVAGPFHLGNVVTHETINVEPYTSRVVVAGAVPTIYKGIPLRMQSLTVEVNRQGFMLNPTNCGTPLTGGALLTESMLTGTTLLGSNTFTTAEVKSQLAIEECNKLAFKPSFGAIAGAKTSRVNGANIEVNISQPAGQANIRQVTTTLPSQLPVRLSTLSKACPAATFEAGPAPGGCKSESMVGTVNAVTPVLPGTLTGQAYLVSHGNEAYPNLDLILRGGGVTVILVGHTKITNSVITTSFESLPDVPLSSFSLYLPSGPNSVLGANGNLCRSKLRMDTTIVGQNAATIFEEPTIAVRNCPVEVVKHKTSGRTATLTVQVPAAGKISFRGTELEFVTRNIGKAERATVKVPLTRIGGEVLRKFRQLRIKIRVGFVPKQGKLTSKAFATVTFRA
jgi:hypothetical protein